MDKFCSFLTNLLNFYSKTNFSLENIIFCFKYVIFHLISKLVKNRQILFIFNQLAKFLLQDEFFIWEYHFFCFKYVIFHLVSKLVKNGQILFIFNQLAKFLLQDNFFTWKFEKLLSCSIGTII